MSKEIKNFALQTGLKRAVDINQFKSLPTIDPETASEILAALAENEGNMRK